LSEPIGITDFAALLNLLSGAGVEFVVIGGLAAAVHGSPRLTRDVDVVYARSPANVARLARALAGHSPYLRGAPPGLPFQWDERTIRMGLNFTLTTDLGSLDLLGEVVGGGTYEQLLPQSIETELFSVRCRCVDQPMLIRLKRAAGRPKDLEAIAELEELLRRSAPRRQ
jgi:predicted nucleotidyltransferase